MSRWAKICCWVMEQEGLATQLFKITLLYTSELWYWIFMWCSIVQISTVEPFLHEMEHLVFWMVYHKDMMIFLSTLWINFAQSCPFRIICGKSMRVVVTNISYWAVLYCGAVPYYTGGGQARNCSTLKMICGKEEIVTAKEGTKIWESKLWIFNKSCGTTIILTNK